MNLFHYYHPDGRIQHSQTATSHEKAQATCEVLGLPFVESALPGAGYVHGNQFVPFPEKPSSLHIFDYAMKAWVDPRDLDQHKAAAWERIKVARAVALNAGVDVPELGRFDSDEVARGNLTGTYAVLDAQPEDWIVEWTRFDDSVAVLDKAAFRLVALTVLSYANQVHARGRALRDAIAEAQSQAELALIEWE